MLAAGIGGNPLTQGKDGTFMILDGPTLSVMYEDRKTRCR